MAITRSFSNAFEVVDYTQELQVIPNSWTLLNDVGLFTDESLSTHTATFEEQNFSLGLIGDAIRGSKPMASQDATRKVRSFVIPHFPQMDAILPQDIQGKRAYGSVDMAETEGAVMLRKMERIAKAHDVTLEVARFKTLTTGDLYAPNGTIAGNIFTEFGVTQKSVAFALGTTTTDVISKVEEVIAHMQDNANNGDVISSIVAYASPEFFAALISHAKVQAAYQYFTATEGQLIQRNRAGGGNGLYREFQYGGIRFIEVRTVLAGQRLVPANECVFVPLGTSDTFVTYYGPANRFEYVNTLAERRYMWSTRDAKGERIDIDSESNFLNMVKRPKLVVKGTVA